MVTPNVVLDRREHEPRHNHAAKKTHGQRARVRHGGFTTTTKPPATWPQAAARGGRRKRGTAYVACASGAVSAAAARPTVWRAPCSRRTCTWSCAIAPAAPPRRWTSRGPPARVPGSWRSPLCRCRTSGLSGGCRLERCASVSQSNRGGKRAGS